MTENKTPARAEIASQYKWNAESVFADHAAWEQAAGELNGLFDQLGKKRGHLGEGVGRGSQRVGGGAGAGDFPCGVGAGAPRRRTRRRRFLPRRTRGRTRPA